MSNAVFLWICCTCIMLINLICFCCFRFSGCELSGLIAESNIEVSTSISGLRVKPEMASFCLILDKCF